MCNVLSPRDVYLLSVAFATRPPDAVGCWRSLAVALFSCGPRASHLSGRGGIGLRAWAWGIFSGTPWWSSALEVQQKNVSFWYCNFDHFAAAEQAIGPRGLNPPPRISSLMSSSRAAWSQPFPRAPLWRKPPLRHGTNGAAH